MLDLARTRQDEVDGCRDRVTLPRVDKLRPWATVYRPADGSFKAVEEISMEQSILFEISTSTDAYALESAKVIETWLWFPGEDGSLLRAPFSDPTLDRCIERALSGAVVDSPGAVAGERFRIAGGGEAVYDLR